MDEFSKLCQDNHGLKRKPITTRNPQFNSIIKKIHQTIGNIVRALDVSNTVKNNQWSGILAATMFVVRATYHTTLQAYKIPIVFGQDVILNIKHVADWKTFEKAIKNKLIVIISGKICAVIITSTRLVERL